MGDVRDKLLELNRKLVQGKLSEEQWYADSYEVIRDGHLDAIRLGALRAGAAEKDLDLKAIGREARGIADGQTDYLVKFLEDLKGERYRDEAGELIDGAFDYRSELYVGRMRGTANGAFVSESDDDARFTWQLGIAEHCPDCIYYSEIMVDVPESEVIAYPGDGQSACLSNCQCTLVRSDGTSGFGRVDWED